MKTGRARTQERILRGAPARPGPFAIAKATSGNSKLGDAATTYAAQTSCPPDCVFFDGGGCYAETGRIGKFVTAPLNAAAAEHEHDALDVALAEAATIDELEVVPGRPLRLHTVGDCASNLAALVVAGAAKRYVDAGGGPVWTYTHAWRSVDRAAWGTVSVLASCESAADVELARSRGYATALVVEAFESDRLHAYSHAGTAAKPLSSTDADAYLHAESMLLPCPSQTRDVHCSDCRLCFDDAGIRERGYSIGFELHGVPLALRQARRALREPGNPRRRMLAEDELRELLERKPEIGPTAAARELDLEVGYTGQLLAFLRGQAEHPSVLRRRRYDRKRAA